MRKWKHALLALAMGVLVLLSFLPVDAKASEGASQHECFNSNSQKFLIHAYISKYQNDEI